MKKRFLSVLLCVCMVLTLTPTVAFAAGGSGGWKKVEIQEDMSNPIELSSGNYYVEGKITNTIVVPAGKKVVLDIRDEASIDVTDGTAITVAPGSTLTIEGEGTVRATCNSKSTCALTNQGTTVINGGTFEGNKTDYVILNQTLESSKPAKMEINSGIINADNPGTSAVCNAGGTLIINDGDISAVNIETSNGGWKCAMLNSLILPGEGFDTGYLDIRGGTLSAELIDGTPSSAIVNYGNGQIAGGKISGNVETWSFAQTYQLEDKTYKTKKVEGDIEIVGGQISGDVLAVKDTYAKIDTSPKVAISGGEIIGNVGVGLFEDTGITELSEYSEKDLELIRITGGFFSNAVEQGFLEELVNVQVEIDQEGVNAHYGYFASEDLAEKALAEKGYSATTILTIDEDKAMFIKGGAGFIGTGKKDGNTVLNNLAPLALGEEGAHWGDNSEGITNCGDNVLYAAFKAAKDDEQNAKTYRVKFKNNKGDSYSELVHNVKKGGIVYFTPSNQDTTTKKGIPKYDFQGKYTVELTESTSPEVILSLESIDVYKVTLKADNVTVTGETLTIYTDKEGADPDNIEKPDSFKLASGFDTITWSETKVSDDGYKIELTASGSSAAVTTPSSSNGSFSVSNKNAKAGDTVTVTPKPDEGYVVDEVTVTDKNGNTIDVKMNDDGTYSFVMPEKAAQPVKVEVTFKEEAGAGDNPSAQFTDVVPGAWYQDAVNYAIKNGLMEGTSATTFEPNTKTSRGMVVTILHRLEGTPSAAAAGFGDVASGQWYTDAVSWAAANGIVTGYDTGNFGPNDIVTREQMAAILYRYASYKAYGTDAQANLTSYTDAGAISGYAESAMKWANAEGLITGTTTTTLSPAGDASRAEVATILMRFCEEVAK